MRNKSYMQKHLLSGRERGSPKIETLSDQKEEEKRHCLATTTYTTQPFSRVSPNGSILYFFLLLHIFLYLRCSKLIHLRSMVNITIRVILVSWTSFTHLSPIQLSFPHPDLLSYYVWYYLISFQTLWEKNNLEKFPAPKNHCKFVFLKSKKIYFSLHFMVIMMIYIFTLSVVGAS